MTPARLDLVLYAGDIGDFDIHFVDNLGAPIDLTAYTWAAQIRQTRESTQKINLVVNNVDEFLGILKIEIPGSVTRTLVDSLWNKSSVWDLQSTLGFDESVTLLQGDVICTLDVTR